MNTLLIGITTFVAMFITIILGFKVIPTLRSLKVGQTILEIGPRWHKDKEGTPTMGGILFIIGITLAVITGLITLNIKLGNGIINLQKQDNLIMLLSLVMAISFGLIGFFDDYMKIKQRKNLGLTGKQKIILQLVVSAAYMLISYMCGEKSTIIWLPFIGQWDIGFWYYILLTVGIMFTVNVANLTDGIDGLCSSVTLVSSIGLLLVSIILGLVNGQILSAALAGGCIGFLFWNAYPAKIFMGDTGSMFLGGMIMAVLMTIRQPSLIIFCGFIYIIEGLSVVLQTFYFKYTRHKYGEGKRLFKMTPIHHSFEMSGWSENKIVIVFSMVQAIMSALGVFAITSI